MSELAPTHGLIGQPGGATPQALLPPWQLASGAGAVGAQIAMPGSASSYRLPVSGGRAAVPHQAALLYQLLLDDGGSVPATWLHLAQRSAGLVSLEARVPGRDLGGLSRGANVTMAGRAVDLAGRTIATEQIVQAAVMDIVWTGSEHRLYAMAAMPVRAPHQVALPTLLYVQEASSGRRSVRFPLTWGVQAGDVLTHADIDPLVVGTFSATIDRRYRVMEATEAA